MTTPFETAKRKPTVEDADYNHEVEAQNSDGNRGSWGYLDVLSDPSRFPYWWPRNNLPTYAPQKRWTVHELYNPGRFGVVRDKRVVASSFCVHDYGSDKAARAVAQAACDKANEVAP